MELGESIPAHSIFRSYECIIFVLRQYGSEMNSNDDLDFRGNLYPAQGETRRQFEFARMASWYSRWGYKPVNELEMSEESLRVFFTPCRGE